MRVLVMPEVRQYLKRLSQILYDKDYFGYLDYAEKYVERLFGDITTTLPTCVHRPAPRHFDPAGEVCGTPHSAAVAQRCGTFSSPATTTAAKSFTS